MRKRNINIKVEVNPFLNKATINSKIKNILYTKIIYYECIDDWNSFSFNNMVFDIHFHYDAEFSVTIYPVKNNKIDYSKNYKVDLIIKLTDDN